MCKVSERERKTEAEAKKGRPTPSCSTYNERHRTPHAIHVHLYARISRRLHLLISPLPERSELFREKKKIL